MLRTRPKPQSRVGKFAHDAALHYLARAKEYDLNAVETANLLEVVLGHTSAHDHEAAQLGIEWMRERDRRQGKTPKF